MTRHSRLPPLPSLRELLSLYKITAKKNLSQNFLLNLKLCEEIVKVGFRLSNYHTVAWNQPWRDDDSYQLPRNFSKNDIQKMNHDPQLTQNDLDYYNKVIIEIGCGPGAITRPLLDAGCRQLIGVELDERFFPGLSMIGQTCDRFKLVHGDILKVDERELLETLVPKEDYHVESWEEPSPVAFIGNLPFQISTPLLFKWMRQISTKSGSFAIAGRSEMILMFQDEVAQKICASNKTKSFGRLSVVAQNQCECDYLFKVRSGSFTPPPKIDGAMVRLTPRVQPLADVDSILLERFCNIIFKSRRKSLFNNFRMSSIDEPIIKRLFEVTAEVSSEAYNARPEALTVKQIASLAREFFTNPEFKDASAHHREEAMKSSKVRETKQESKESRVDEMERLANRALSKRKPKAPRDLL